MKDPEKLIGKSDTQKEGEKKKEKRGKNWNIAKSHFDYNYYYTDLDWFSHGVLHECYMPRHHEELQIVNFYFYLALQIINLWANGRRLLSSQIMQEYSILNANAFFFLSKIFYYGLYMKFQGT